MRVLVTGAGGFVGRAVCHELAAAGLDVVAAARRPEGVPPGIAVRPVADVGPETDWGPALEGVEAVAHLAARVHVMRETAGDAAARYRRVNAEGTRRLAEACAEAGVRRFVYLSTVKVMGERSGSAPLTESDGPRPADAYARSKWEAEQALAEIAERTGLEVVVLRAPLVYGPGVKGNFLALMCGIERGWPLPVGALRNRRSLVYVGNLANAIRLCLERPAPTRGTYLVCDADDVSTPELARRMAEAMGARARLLGVPAPLLRLAGLVAGRPDSVARLADSLAVDSSRIQRELGWRPPYSMAEGLAQTARWFRVHDRDES